MIKRHTKPTKENKGGIISKENFIHQSNVKNIDVKKISPKYILAIIDKWKNKGFYPDDVVLKKGSGCFGGLSPCR